MARKSFQNFAAALSPIAPGAEAALLVDQLSNRAEHTPGQMAGDVLHAVRQESPADAFAANLRERIAKRAYELAERRGFSGGNEVGDWLRAEREVLAAPGMRAAFEDQYGG